MKAKINCGCEKCCNQDTPHKLTISKDRQGVYHAHGHNGTDEIIEGAKTWDDIRMMYSDYNTWCYEEID